MNILWHKIIGLGNSKHNDNKALDRQMNAKSLDFVVRNDETIHSCHAFLFTVNNLSFMTKSWLFRISITIFIENIWDNSNFLSLFEWKYKNCDVGIYDATVDLIQISYQPKSSYQQKYY